MTLINWRPKSYDLFREFDDTGNRLFGLTMFPAIEKGFSKGGWPALDVEEDKNNISIKADLPGLKQEEIENIRNISKTILEIVEEESSSFHVTPTSGDYLYYSGGAPVYYSK